MLKAVFFDLDGTLLPMDEVEFTKGYFYTLYEKVSPYGYEKDSLIKFVYSGLEAMMKNDGKQKNIEVFRQVFKNLYGENRLKDKEIFDDYYANEFLKMKSFCKENKYAKDIVNFVNNNVGLCILSTNPIFPLVATEERMGFVGLNKNDFDYITSYENSSFCKPNPLYFKDLLEKFNLKAEEVILFGNNVVEDFECAKKCGIKTYLIDGYILNKDKITPDCCIIEMKDVIDTIKNEINLRK